MLQVIFYMAALFIFYSAKEVKITCLPFIVIHVLYLTINVIIINIPIIGYYFDLLFYVYFYIFMLICEFNC